MVVDDYGHHPTEIAAVLAAARAGLNRPPAGRPFHAASLHATQQPLHRVQHRARAQQTSGAGRTSMMAGEDPIPGRDDRRLGGGHLRHTPRHPSRSSGAITDLPPRWPPSHAPGDMILTLGAGSIGTAGHALVDLLNAPSTRHHLRHEAAHARRKNECTTPCAPADKRFEAARVSRRASAAPGTRASAIAKPVRLRAGLRREPRDPHRRPRQACASTASPSRATTSWPPRDMAALFRGLRGSNIMQPDLDGWRTRSLRSPWIKDAALRRILPSTIELADHRTRTARPGSPRTIVSTSSSTDGVIIDDAARDTPPFDLPIIDGLHTPPTHKRPPGSTRPAPPWPADVLKHLQQLLVGPRRPCLASRRLEPRRRRHAAGGRPGPRPPGTRTVRRTPARISGTGADPARTRAGHRLRGSPIRSTHLRAARSPRTGRSPPPRPGHVSNEQSR